MAFVGVIDHFVFGETDYISVSNHNTGYIPFQITYKVKDGVSLTNMKVVIRIPSNSDFVESTLKVNGEVSHDYEYNNGLLTLPVSGNEAKISFCVKPTSYAVLLTYAKITFRENGKSSEEILGVANTSVPDISVAADAVASDSVINVEGIAPGGATVELFVDGAPAGSAQAIKSGQYSATVTLPSPTNYKKYKISARVNIDGQYSEASTEVTFEDGAPSLDKLLLYYGRHGKGIDRCYDLTGTSKSKPYIIFNPAFGFRFEASFNHPENIKDVYIVSTRNNQKKYMTAHWDESLGLFVAEGSFEDTPRNYVPGVISVEYTKKRREIPIGDTFDTNEILEYLDPSVRNFGVTLEKNTPEEYVADISVTEELTDLLGKEFKMTVKTIDKYYNDVSISDLMSVAENFYSYFFDKDGKKYILNLGKADGHTIVAVVHDITGSKLMEYIIEDLDRPVIDDASFEAWKKLDSFTEKLNNFDTVVGVINDLWDIEDSDNELRDKIQAADMTPAERAEALKKASELKSDRQMFLLLTTCFTVATAAYAGPPALVFSLILGAITTSSDFFWNMRMANILNCGTGFSCNWCIDPSGYVYEAVTQNRVSDVTATAYWISPDYINENGEGDTSKAVVWDASEYAQMNPMLTDETGAYAWDVPEGLWQVKYEKEGYKTAYSDWLPVPPPQTDVNVGLISTEAPRIESAVLIPGGATLNFTQYMQPETVKNLTVTSADGKTLDYTVICSSDETAPDGTVTVVYSDGTTATVTFKQGDSEVTVPTNGKKPVSVTVTSAILPEKAEAHVVKSKAIRGDLNSSGKVDVMDGVIMQRILAGLETDSALIALANLDGAGKVDVKDGVIMQRILAGLES